MPRVVIGLEIHIQLTSAETKIFCGSPNHSGGEANMQTCPICLGLPGTLPVLNEKVLERALRFAVAVGADVPEQCRFARKNYFYPDLPKGYQISQFEHCLAYGGSLDIEVNGKTKRVGLDRIQLEEDAGKSLHAEDSGMSDSLVDMNRCGTPLLEVISLPQPGQPNTVADPSLYMNTPDEAIAFWMKMRQIARYLEVSDCSMELGNMRCDANMSIWDEERNTFGTKTEIKNLNSYRYAHRALSLEVERHQEVIEEGGKVKQQTMQFDPGTDVVSPMRSKEEAHDYRYFPEPDLVPVSISAELREQVRAELPEMPDVRRARFSDAYALADDVVELLTADRPMADYFEAVVALSDEARVVANWVMGDVQRELNQRKIAISDFPVSPTGLSELIALVTKGAINQSTAKDVFSEMVETSKSAPEIVKEQGLEQISDTDSLSDTVDKVLAAHPDESERYRAGDKKLVGFFMGQIMRESKGQANPKLVNQLLREKLG
jgi:aspartyl-tRNA(Asn)/glutamyl-tRNA(Gln) amidotransferase subunit B